ncbi:MAG: hypothetical protein KGN02_08150 [bacterium]|nr:hypothetical protein [bacterium]
MLRVEHNGTPLSVKGLSARELMTLAGSSAVLAVDSSFLLSVIDSDSLSLQETKKIFDNFGDRLVVPATVAGEVRRLGAAKVEEAVRRSGNGITFTVRSVSRGIGESERSSIQNEFATIKARYEATWRSAAAARLHQVLETVDSRTCAPLPAAEYDRIRRTAPFRYARSIPPGFTDATKSLDLRFNDLIIWFELIAIARVRRAPIFLVTNERKKDWWRVDGKNLEGTHPALVFEMFAEAGQRVALIFGPTLVPQYESAKRTATYAWPAFTYSSFLAQALAAEALANRFAIQVPAFERLQRTLGLALPTLNVEQLANANSGVASLGKLIANLQNKLAAGLGPRSVLEQAGLWSMRDFGALSRKNEDLWNSIAGGRPSIASALGLRSNYPKNPSWLELQRIQLPAWPAPSYLSEIAQSSLALSPGKHLERLLGTFAFSPTSQLQQLYNSIRENQLAIDRMQALWAAMRTAPLRVDSRIQRLIDLSVDAERDVDLPRRAAARLRRRRKGERRRLRRQLRGGRVNLFRSDTPVDLGA